MTAISHLNVWSFGPCWSSRNRIAYFSHEGGNKLKLWTVLPDGSELRQITNRPGECRQPWWSPDGATLAFSANDASERFQLWLSGGDGSGGHALTTAGDWQQPFWSPDGRRLAVSAKFGDAKSQILVIDVSNSDAERIEQPEDNNVHPAWSPDGRSIVFTAGRGDGSALWRFDFQS